MNFVAIVLAHRDHKERDRLYTLFTRELGKLVVRGSGARKSGAKLAPHLEPMMVSHVAVAKNRGRGTLTFAVCEESFWLVRDDVDAFGFVLRVLAVAEKMLREEDVHGDVYDVLMVYLHTMEALVARGAARETLSVVTEGALFHLLARLGWHVASGQCARCGTRLPSEERYAYVFRDGGFVCGNCLRGTSLSSRDVMWVSRDVAAAVHVFATNSVPSLAKLSVPRVVCDELVRLTDRRVEWVR